MPYILPSAKHPALRLPGTTSLARSSLPWLAAIAKGPQIGNEEQGAEHLHRPARPLSAAPNIDPMNFSN